MTGTQFGAIAPNSDEMPVEPGQKPALVLACKFVLPHSQDAPAEGTQRAIHQPVAGLIGRDLLPPERRVGLGPGGVLGAPRQ